MYRYRAGFPLENTELGVGVTRRGIYDIRVGDSVRTVFGRFALPLKMWVYDRDGQKVVLDRENFRKEQLEKYPNLVLIYAQPRNASREYVSLRIECRGGAVVAKVQGIARD
jgi:hypothetical protein